MAYTVQNALDVAQKMGKGVPFTGIDTKICDIVSAEIWRYYPWRSTLKASPDNWTEVSLTDGNQDFSTGLTDVFRMTQFWIRRTDVTPEQVWNINVAKNCFIDPSPKSPTSIRNASYQAGVNKFRLESAVRIPTGSTWKIGGEYQPTHTQITSLASNIWLDTQYLDVYAKGLVYWAYRLADDSRAGAVQFVSGRPVVKTGAAGEWYDAIEEMAAAEDFGNIDGYYPDSNLGAVDGRRWYANELFPYLVS